MAWIEPKTDWVSSDYINVEDYNRIIGNLAYLKAELDTLFIGIDKITTGEEKAVKARIFASEINAIETSLETLNFDTYNFDIGETKEYLPNTRTIDYVELNRIESAIFMLYEQIENHRQNLTRLAFTLGNQKGIRV